MAQYLFMFLLLLVSCTNCATSKTFDEKNEMPDTYYKLQAKNNFKRSAPYQETGPDEDSQPLSLTDIFNQRVNGQSDMCPRQNVLLFFLTGNIQHLRNCVNTTFVPGSSEESHEESQPQNHMISYSGKLLKRILQNIGDGTAKVDFDNGEGQEQGMGGTDKRARLSINSALGSLVEMLRHESRGHRRPQYAFHQDLLHMG